MTPPPHRSHGAQGGRLLPALFAHRCPGCGQLRSGHCDYCRALLAQLPEGVAPSGFAAARVYEGLVRDLITGLKYANGTYAVGLLAEALDGVHARIGPVDLITWAPTWRGRRHRRGFDQAEQLARAVGRRWRVPVRGLLVRDTRASQTGRSRGERLGGPRFRSRTAARWAHVVILDDVVTTGSTLASAVEAVRAAGARQVSAVAVAATPLPTGLTGAGRPVPSAPCR